MLPSYSQKAQQKVRFHILVLVGLYDRQIFYIVNTQTLSGLVMASYHTVDSKMVYKLD